MMLRRCFMALGLALTLAGCGSSPPTRYYTLDAVPATARPAAGPPLQVVAVHIPPALDRQEMVRETAANQVEVSDQNRWSAPFDQMAQRVLTQDLAARLPKGAVILPEQPAPPNARKIVVDILQFERQASGDVTFDGSWSLLSAGAATPIASRHVHLQQAAGADYTAQAQAMSRILGTIADQIAASSSIGGRS